MNRWNNQKESSTDIIRIQADFILLRYDLVYETLE